MPGGVDGGRGTTAVLVIIHERVVEELFLVGDGLSCRC